MPSRDAAGPTRIRVASAAPYDVVVGPGALDELPAALGEGVRRVAVIGPPGPVGAEGAWGEVLDRLAVAGLEAHPVAIPAGEAAKTAEVAVGCWAELGRAGLTRSDAVVGVGGGAATDLAGFVAATFLRGVRAVLVPTTLLGMVDAAVGGKTAIDTDEGKNLVGAIHEPAAVLCDPGWLATLPAAEMSSGLAEVVKCGFVADPAILDLVERRAPAATDPAAPELRELIERAVTVKARVVADDLRERTSVGTLVGREVLNYGHTLGHGVERVEGYRWRHGFAVSVGLVYAAELARLAGRLDARVVARHRRVLGLVGLPTSYAGRPWAELRAAIAVDKKARGDRLRFVILDAEASPAILEAPDEDLLAAAYAALAG